MWWRTSGTPGTGFVFLCIIIVITLTGASSHMTVVKPLQLPGFNGALLAPMGLILQHVEVGADCSAAYVFLHLSC